MKIKKYFGIIVILVMLLTLAITSTVSAAAEKVAVCHLDELGVYHLISISESAFPAHVAHMDASPSDWVPGQPGKKFAADCSLISIEKYTWVETMTIPSKPATLTPTVTYSVNTLTLNQLYQLRASGYYKYGNFGAYPLGYADAKFSNRPASVQPYIAGWIDGAALWPDPLKCYGLQVTVWDGDTAKPLLPAGWVEPYNDTHNYTASFTGTGAKLGLFIWDDQYSDNVGDLTVDIYKVNW